MVPPQEDAKSGLFNTTPWSLLFSSLHGACPTAAQTALGELCETYWRPIYLFIRQSGFDLYDAQDLTQSFMAYLIEREVFVKADRHTHSLPENGETWQKISISGKKRSADVYQSFDDGKLSRFEAYPPEPIG